VAHIDNLIDSIKDPQLRAALRAEYDKVTKHRRMGLVFDRHLPESVVLPGFAVREGEKVQVLADGSDDPANLDGTGVWTVTKIGTTHSELRDGNGDTRQVQNDRLVATREFGDPIYPGFVSTGRVVRGGGADGDDGGKPFHTVINAENYHALEALLFAYEGQVDAIYIDPPYNTGARDWKYNNDYVDEADPYRHSKWLSFMERRLLLAKRLLNPADSVLIVTIDEKEYLRLGLLLEQTFPAAAMQMISSVTNPAGAGRSYEFARTDEYIFVVRIGSAKVRAEQRQEEQRPVTWDTLRRSDYASRRGTVKGGPAQFYPIYVNPETKRIEAIGDPLPHDRPRTSAPEREGCVAVFPVRPDGTEMNWGIGAALARDRLASGYLRVGRAKPGEPQPFVISYLTGGIVDDIAAGNVEVVGRAEDGSVQAHYVTGRTVMPTTNWNRPSHDAQRYGTELLKALVPGRRFPYPKSLYAVEDSLRFFVADKPDALILDFFAGSGTTTHAVMRLNRQDGGRRRSICVTNNEVSADEQARLRARGLKPSDEEWEALGICDYITKPRIRAAITGRTPSGVPIEGSYRFVDEFPMADGFCENAEFFTLTYEDPALVSLGRRFEAIAPLLWLRAGARGARISQVAEEGWSIPKDAYYGVLFDTSAWGAFVAAARQRDDLTHAFIVTDSLVEYQQIVAKLDPALATTRLYADYLSNFEINTRGT
jgi:adenine-specific DNA-methyltransferase